MLKANVMEPLSNLQITLDLHWTPHWSLYWAHTALPQTPHLLTQTVSRDMVLAFAAVDELQSVTTKQKLRLSSTSSVALFNMLY